jgi:hypothetical protein
MPSAEVGKSYVTYQYGRIRVTAIMGDTVFFYVFDGDGSKSTVEVSKARFITLTEEKPEREPEVSIRPVEKKKPVPVPVLERKATEKTEEQKKTESDDDLIDGGFIGFRPRHINKKDGDEGASLPSVPSIMPQKGQRMKAKLRSLGGFSFLARRDPGEGGVEGLAEPLALLPGVRLDVALGDVNQHRDLPLVSSLLVPGTGLEPV